MEKTKQIAEVMLQLEMEEGDTVEFKGSYLSNTRTILIARKGHTWISGTKKRFTYSKPLFVKKFMKELLTDAFKYYYFIDKYPLERIFPIINCFKKNKVFFEIPEEEAPLFITSNKSKYIFAIAQKVRV